LLFAAFACAHAPDPAEEPQAAPTPTPVTAPPPQTVSPAAPSPPAPGTEEPVAAKVKGTTPILIEEGGETEEAGPSLAEVAARERERRRTAGPPLVIVDDKNLAQHATGGLTTATPVEEPAAPVPDVVADEQYWRQRVRGLREQWALAVEAILDLESRAAGLRTRFYSEDDPYVRDGQIKPAWDHALESLEAARKRASELEERLAVVLEEGQQAGALPGWLRDGVDLEPSQRPYQAPQRRRPKGEPEEGDELIGEPVESDGR
jgi:hypothetical protein